MEEVGGGVKKIKHFLGMPKYRETMQRKTHIYKALSAGDVMCVACSGGSRDQIQRTGNEYNRSTLIVII